MPGLCFMASASVMARLLNCAIRRRPRVGAGLLENSPRDLAAHVLVEVHLPNSFDGAAQPRIDVHETFRQCVPVSDPKT